MTAHDEQTAAPCCGRPEWTHRIPFACTEHGPCCDRNLTAHPLPTREYGPIGRTHLPDGEDLGAADPTGYESRRAAALWENGWNAQREAAS